MASRTSHTFAGASVLRRPTPRAAAAAASASPGARRGFVVRSGPARVTVKDARDLLAKGEHVYLDVRTTKEYGEQHVVDGGGMTRVQRTREIDERERERETRRKGES